MSVANLANLESDLLCLIIWKHPVEVAIGSSDTRRFRRRSSTHRCRPDRDRYCSGTWALCPDRRCRDWVVRAGSRALAVPDRIPMHSHTPHSVGKSS